MRDVGVGGIGWDMRAVRAGREGGEVVGVSSFQDSRDPEGV
jgi:hypothetical protein